MILALYFICWLTKQKVGVSTYLLGLAGLCSCRSMHVGASVSVGGRVISYGMSFSYSVGVRCRCELAIFLANSTWSYSLQWWGQIWLPFANTVWWSQWLWVPFSYHRSKQMPSEWCMHYIARTAYLLWQLLHASKPLVYALYNGWIELAMECGLSFLRKQNFLARCWLIKRSAYSSSQLRPR